MPYRIYIINLNGKEIGYGVNIVTINNKELAVCFDYDIVFIEKIKTINGRRWDPSNKYWTVPNNEYVRNQLRDLFEVTYTIDKVLVKYEEMLSLKGFTQQTKKVYLVHCRKFLLITNKNVYDLVTEDVEKYLFNLLEKQNNSHSYVNQALSAIKFLFNLF